MIKITMIRNLHLWSDHAYDDKDKDKHYDDKDKDK